MNSTRTMTWLFAVALLAPRLAAAEDAERALDQAIAAYIDLDIERALRLLDEALASGSLSDAERPRALMYRGLAQASLGRAGEADESFVAALELDAALRLPEDTSPVVRERFEALRRSIEPDVSEPEPSPPDEPASPPIEPEPTGPAEAVAPPPRRLLSWVFLGLTGAAFAGGATSLILALATRAAALDAPVSQAEADDRLATYRVEARLATGLLSATVALGVATLVAFLGERPRRDPPALSVLPAPAGLSVSASF